MVKVGKDGKKKVEFDNEHVRRSRLRIDTRKWLAGKLKPKVYGERQTVDIGVEVTLTLEEQVAQAKEAATRLGIVLPLHLLGDMGSAKAK
jgi:hypothetical protein